ncbi:MAG: N-6 DNA methylase, partial [Vicinamibacterales bacterium]
MRGLSGSLFSLQFLHDLLPSALAGELGGKDNEPARRRARSALAGLAALGPASPVRAVFDLGAAPLVSLLGFRAAGVDTLHSGLLTSVLTPAADHSGRATPSVVLIVAPWEAPLDRAWRDAVSAGIAAGAQWALCHNGRVVRILDARRTFARRYLEFNLDVTLRDAAAFAVLWGLLRADAFARGEGAVIDRALALSDAHQVAVGAALERGVRASVTELTGALGARAVDQALTIVYRILFLLFAEARGLVPMWHPTYRDGYAIGALTDRALAGHSRGLWSALQAASRLAYAGCHAGELVVTPFNGRLFEPARTPLGESRRVNDATVRSVLLALSTTSGDGGRRRVSYGDLGVEQLGAVYESVLDLTTSAESFPNAQRSAKTVASEVTLRTKDQAPRTDRSPRKQTGSFYTPRSLTEYLVRRTLHPLVEGRSTREILSLRVLDLAMGSGAFLVSACRYLAAACERAMMRDGEDPIEPPRLRRIVAQRCLYGVDRNPIAVDLAKLSLWLATLARDHPFTFVDHALRHGDSLVGLSREQIASFSWEPKQKHLLLSGVLERNLKLAEESRVRLLDLGDTDDHAAKVKLLADSEQATQLVT